VRAESTTAPVAHQSSLHDLYDARRRRRLDRIVCLTVRLWARADRPRLTLLTHNVTVRYFLPRSSCTCAVLVLFVVMRLEPVNHPFSHTYMLGKGDAHFSEWCLQCICRRVGSEKNASSCAPLAALLSFQERMVATSEWPGDVMVSALACDSRGCEFNSRPLHCQVTTSRQVVHTHVPLSPAV